MLLMSHLTVIWVLGVGAPSIMLLSYDIELALLCKTNPTQPYSAGTIRVDATTRNMEMRRLTNVDPILQKINLFNTAQLLCII